MSEDVIPPKSFSPEEIQAEAERLLKDITPGDWYIADDGLIRTDASGARFRGEVAQSYDACDDEFIAAAPRLVRQLLDLLRLQEPPRPQWQPITTAPKDGSVVMVGTVMHVDMASWQDEMPDGIESGVVVDPGIDAGWYGYTGCCPGEWQPTHWMPLPDPPASPPEGDRP